MAVFYKQGKKLPRQIPKPSGPYHVGCTDIMTGYSPDGVFIRLFYPAESAKASKSPEWLPHKNYLEGYAMFFKLWPPIFCKYFPKFVGDIQIPAAWDAQPLKIPGVRYPVMVFSHGLGGCRSSYTTYCLELASRGFVVAALEHRDYSASNTFYYERQTVSSPDGGSIENLVRKWMLFQKVKAGKEEYYIRNQQVHQRAQECSEVLDLLSALNDGEKVHNVMDHTTVTLDLGSFGGILDLDRVSVAGHSFGGATVITALAKDKRFKTGLGLDTWMLPLKQETSLFQKVDQPMLFVNMEKFQTKDNLRIMKKMESAYAQRLIITLKGTVHLNQCDVPFLCDSIMRKLFGAHSKMDPFVAMDLTSNLCNVFLSRHMDIPVDAKYNAHIQKYHSELVEGIKIA